MPMIIRHNNLRSVRRSSSLTQSDIGHIMNLQDVTGVSRWEKGHRTPGVETLLMYSLVFDVPVEQLFQRQCEELARDVIIRIGSRLAELRTSLSDRRLSRRVTFLEQALARLNT